MTNKRNTYPQIKGVELDGRRKELFQVMNEKFPGGNKETQKYFCLSIAEDRVEVYLRDFKKV